MAFPFASRLTSGSCSSADGFRGGSGGSCSSGGIVEAADEGSQGHRPTPSARVVAYTSDDVAQWRADFCFKMRQHSIAVFGYDDDELLEWRRPFDEIAEDNRITFPAFEALVSDKYRDAFPDERRAQNIRVFWDRFDKDRSGFIDFGEFMSAGFEFDLDCAKAKIRDDGVEASFAEYSEDGFMSEKQMFQLMRDFNFFLCTGTDVQKLMRLADKDRDGLVSLQDFSVWAQEDLDPAEAGAATRPQNGLRMLRRRD